LQEWRQSREKEQNLEEIKEKIILRQDAKVANPCETKK